MESLDSRTFLPKLLYGVLFTVVVPVFLMLWTHSIERLVSLPALRSVFWGITITTVAAFTMFVGMAVLWFRGGGLPMNAYPPPRFVSTGIYSLVPHPIYGSFVLMCAGASLAFGSACGLWFVTPLMAMACTALVLGYEMPDLCNRFGTSVCRSLWIPDDENTPQLIERLRVCLTVLLPWLAIYQSIGWLGPAPDARVTYAAIESRFPVWQWTEAIYGSVYLVVVLAPLLVRTRRQLRSFGLLGIRAMALVFPLYLLLPFVAPARPFVPSGVWGNLLMFERSFSKGAAAFPSFHVVWALIAATSLGGEGRRGRRWGWQVWAILASLSCITTGMHSIADVVAGFAAYALIVRLPILWMMLLRIFEAIANSWKEWRFGSVRVINHGAYAAVAVFVGICIMSAFLGNQNELTLICVFVLGTVGAALWAQTVEGSPALLRPMGFYGGMLGCIAGALVALAQGINIWNAFAALCMAAPWVQAIGRLRCLVQGCCHGREVHTVPGIRYSHPRSRVCRLTQFGGEAIHATPVYSILWNGFLAAVLTRLAILHAAASTVCAVYLILSGMGRFVEEAYRGEPQTKVIFGLRLYQWAAIGTVMLGAGIMPYGDTAPLNVPVLNFAILPIAIACGLVAWFVCGVDFPESSRRFARLT